MRLLLLAVIPFTAIAQLRLYVAPPNSEEALNGIYDQGSVPVGDTLQTRFRVRNHGVAPVTVNTMSVAGAGFSLANQPSLPHVIAPGLNLDFTVRFQARDFGTYSANLAVNGASVLLRATVLAAVLVRANGNTLSAGSTIDFGRVERGSSSHVAFEFANATTQSVTVRSVQVSGSAFRGSDLPASLDLAAGANATFQIRFEPKAAGVFTGTMSVDGREFRLTGAASEPPFTRPEVHVDISGAASAKQGRVFVRFASPSRAAGSGRLRIAFRPLAPAVDNDAAIQFTGNGSRELPFTVSEGDSEVRFGSVREAIFQTGTTAGTIVVSAEIGGFTEESSVTIAPSPVSFEVGATKHGTSLEVDLRGFDNTHSAGSLTFTFFDRSGNPVQPGAIRVDAGSDFRRYFEASSLGGSFSLKATFPVAGGTTDIRGVEVEMTNSAGAVRSQRLEF